MYHILLTIHADLAPVPVTVQLKDERMTQKPFSWELVFYKT